MRRVIGVLAGFFILGAWLATTGECLAGPKKAEPVVLACAGPVTDLLMSLEDLGFLSPPGE